MSTSFELFKKRATSSNLIEKIAESNQQQNYSDGSWKLSFDPDTSRGEAIIRLLPPKDTDLPYVKYYQHFFKGDDGNWCVISKCLRTFNEECPICTRNKQLYNSNDNVLIAKAKERKGKKYFVFNILVKEDKLHPENNGKVFLWKCGATVFNKIMEIMTPEFDEEPKNPFDIEKGYNLLLRAKKDPNRQNLPQYDNTKFEDKPTPLAKTDKELEEIFNAMPNLNDFLQKDRLSHNEVEEKAKIAYSKILPSTPSFPTPPAEPYKYEEKKTNPAVKTPSWEETVTGGSENDETNDDMDVNWFKDVANNS